MTIKIEAIDFNGCDTKINLDRFPYYCPRCHHKIKPQIVAKFLSGDGANSHILQILCRCPNQKCGIRFFGMYKGVIQAGNAYDPYKWYFFQKSLPEIGRASCRERV